MVEEQREWGPPMIERYKDLKKKIYMHIYRYAQANKNGNQ